MSSVKLNLTFHCRCTVPCQAGGLGQLLQYSICASTMLRAQNRQKVSSKTKHFAPLGILFIYSIIRGLSLDEHATVSP